MINRYQDFAFNLTFKILKNRQDTEESVQDSFVKALKALNAFKRQSSFKTWLYRIVYNTAINKTRGSFLKNVSLIEEVPEEQIPQTFDNSGSKFDKNVYAKIIQAAFDKLTPENRIIMTLFYLEHFSIEEIAEITLLNTNLVKVRLHRSREQLRLLLIKFNHN